MIAVAQDDMVTIADIVVSSSEAEEHKFTTLLAAVGLADESVLEALSEETLEAVLEDMEDAVEVAMVSGDTTLITADDMGIYINGVEIILADIETTNGLSM